MDSPVDAGARPADATFDLDLWCAGCDARISDQEKARMDAHEVTEEQAAAMAEDVAPGRYHALCCPLPECR